jgi:hypothetical protein
MGMRLVGAVAEGGEFDGVAVVSGGVRGCAEAGKHLRLDSWLCLLVGCVCGVEWIGLLGRFGLVPLIS